MDCRRFRIEKLNIPVLLQKGKRKSFLPGLGLHPSHPHPNLHLCFSQPRHPVKEAICWGVHAGPGNTGNWIPLSLLWSVRGAPFSSYGQSRVGSDEAIPWPLSSEMGAWGFAVGQDNRIYLGTYYNAHLLRFDPRSETWEDLGRPGGETESFICQLTVAPDGKIWEERFPRQSFSVMTRKPDKPSISDEWILISFTAIQRPATTA